MRDVVATAARSRRLKYYIHDHSHSFRLQLFGSLTAQDLAELEGCWQTAQPSVAGRKIQLDLRGLVEADAAGQQWLANMVGHKDLQALVSAQMASLIPGTNMEAGKEKRTARKRCVIRLRALLRTSHKASISSEPLEAAAQPIR